MGLKVKKKFKTIGRIFRNGRIGVVIIEVMQCDTIVAPGLDSWVVLPFLVEKSVSARLNRHQGTRRLTKCASSGKGAKSPPFSPCKTSKSVTLLIICTNELLYLNVPVNVAFGIYQIRRPGMSAID
jgi:hypothetical protein